MKTLAEKRKLLNQQQTKLRKVLSSNDDSNSAIQHLMHHHSMLHSALVNPSSSPGSAIWSYEDTVLDDLRENQFRDIHPKNEHSIAWLLWHIARIEDVAMNILVADTQQVFFQDNWLEKLNVNLSHTGNSMELGDIRELSVSVNYDALRAYRVSVGKRSREIFHTLSPERLKEKVDPSRIQRVKDEGAVIQSAYGITDYWSRRNIAGLLLMPATRHNLVHLNEISRVVAMQN